MFETIGGRKFVFACVLVLLFGAFVLAGKMTVDQFMAGSLVALSIFSASNVSQKFAKVNQ